MLEREDLMYGYLTTFKYLGKDQNPNDYFAVKDILDVWFDSGSTHAFVLGKK